MPGDLRGGTGDGSQKNGRRQGTRSTRGIGKTGNPDAVVLTQLIEIYGGEAASFLWHGFDHKTIEDCIAETGEWRKPEAERKQEEDQESYDEFLAENPTFAEDFFAEALRKRKEARLNGSSTKLTASGSESRPPI
jgi:hypothetical protein